jgi:hypothetical protein
LLDYLNANTQEIKYLMVVPSSMQGADYVIAMGRLVLYLGGFSGQDEIVTVGDLAEMVAGQELRYIYWNGIGGGGFRGDRGLQSDLSVWIMAYCAAVEGFEVDSVSAGAPDGVQSGLINNSIPGCMERQMQLTLYDCSAMTNKIPRTQLSHRFSGWVTQ